MFPLLSLWNFRNIYGYMLPVDLLLRIFYQGLAGPPFLRGQTLGPSSLPAFIENSFRSPFFPPWNDSSFWSNSLTNVISLRNIELSESILARTCLFLKRNTSRDEMIAIEVVIPERRKRPLKLSSVRLFEEAMLFWSGHAVLFLYSFLSSSSVAFKIVLDTSDTSGDPFWNACTN